MVASKYVNKIIIALMAFAVVLCILSITYSEQLTELMGGTGVSMEYETELFDTSEPITINVQMDENDWNEMLDNATSETYYLCDVVVNGKKINNVAIRPKGNTSLSAIAMNSTTNRFSFKLEFDYYVDGQTCYGLDKLILNNNYADATNMKEAIIYDMYQYLSADASLYNYAEVYVNGEYWGVYLALEAVEESFLLRNYGTQDGELYKPDSFDMGDGMSGSSNNSGSGGGFGMSNFPTGGSFDMSNFPTGGSFDMSNFPTGGSFDMSQIPTDGSFDMSQIPTNGNESGSRPSNESGEKPSANFDISNINTSGMSGLISGGGANLNYIDDNLDSYSTIWEGEVTKTTKSDHSKVVTALKNISEGTDLEKYLDVDNILKYMAVHTFAVNMDSLSGSMAHNYYLYEYDGQLNLIPWDYNLSLGGMSMGSSASASSVINDAIDTPFDGTNFFDALLENEEYLERYHEYLQQLVDEYVNGGGFEETYNRIRKQIDSLVETDPTAFYTYEEYSIAADMLYDTIMLRAESISGQLNGTIPSTDAGQKADSSSLIDASGINIECMGQFNMSSSFSNSNSSEDGKIDIPGFDSSNLPEGFDMSNIPNNGNFDMGSLDMSDFGGFNGTTTPTASLNNTFILVLCFGVMIIAGIGLKLFKRRKGF